MPTPYDQLPTVPITRDEWAKVIDEYAGPMKFAFSHIAEAVGVGKP